MNGDSDLVCCLLCTANYRGEGEAELCCACAPPRPDLNWWYLVSTAHISSDKDKIFHWTLAESDPGWSLDFSLLVLIIFTNTAINLASKTNDEIFHLETCIFVLLHISIIYFDCRLLLELDNCRYWAVQKVRHGVTVRDCKGISWRGATELISSHFQWMSVDGTF